VFGRIYRLFSFYFLFYFKRLEIQKRTTNKILQKKVSILVVIIIIRLAKKKRQR
jgi:hypothetical protein